MITDIDKYFSLLSTLTAIFSINQVLKSFCVSSFQMRMENPKAGRKGNLNVATEVSEKTTFTKQFEN